MKLQCISVEQCSSKIHQKTEEKLNRVQEKVEIRLIPSQGKNLGHKNKINPYCTEQTNSLLESTRMCTRSYL